MKLEEIIQGLKSKGFSDTESSVIAPDLFNISPALQPLLESWLKNGREEDYETSSFSIKELMKKYGLEYQAALLSIDWLIKEPEIATQVILQGIR